MAYIKDLDDFPLKPPQQTFVDEPELLEDVLADELVFDLSNGLREINKMHVFHAIRVLEDTVNSIVRIRQQPERFAEFRRQQLALYGLSMDLPAEALDVIDVSKLARRSTTLVNSTTPPTSPPLKYARIPTAGGGPDILKESTPDSLSSCDSGESTEAPYRPIEELVKNLSLAVTLDPITNHSQERLQNELNYHQAGRNTNQAAHLLKIFNLVKVPPILPEQFLLRIHTYSSSTSVLVYIHSAFLIFRLAVLLDVLPLSEFNVHRVILALIRCLTKKLEDVYQKQKAFSTVGGVSQKELFKIEVSFLYLCNFKLIVGRQSLDRYLKEQFTDLHHFLQKLCTDENPKA